MGRSTITLFECVASGVSWDEVVNPILTHISAAEGLILTFFIAFTLFAVLNVVTGVVLDTAMKFAHEEEDRRMLDSLVSAFELDADDVTKEISWHDFEASAESGEMGKFFASIDVDKHAARAIFELADSDRSGGLTAVELFTSLMGLRGPAQAMRLAVVDHQCRRIYNSVCAQAEILDTIYCILSQSDETTWSAPEQFLKRRAENSPSDMGIGSSEVPYQKCRRREVRPKLSVGSADLVERSSEISGYESVRVYAVTPTVVQDDFASNDWVLSTYESEDFSSDRKVGVKGSEIPPAISRGVGCTESARSTRIRF